MLSTVALVQLAPSISIPFTAALVHIVGGAVLYEVAVALREKDVVDCEGLGWRRRAVFDGAAGDYGAESEGGEGENGGWLHG